MQLPLFEPSSEWRAPRIEELPSWANAKKVAFDLETRDPHLRELGPGIMRSPRQNYVVGFSFAVDNNRGYYIPLRHSGGDNVENPDKYLEWLRYQARNFTGDLILMNGSYDLGWCHTINVEFPNINRFRDVMIAETLIYELHMSYSLDAILGRRKLPLKDTQLLIEAAKSYGVNPKGDMWKLPARFVGPYGEADATLPLKLLELQEKDIEDQNLQNIWDLESDLLPVLVRMRRRGIRIDEDKLSQIEDWSIREEKENLDFVYDRTGVRIAVGDVWKAGAIAPALENVGIRLGKTPKSGAPKIDKFVLENTDHPVTDALARARKVNKLRTTFAESVRRHTIDGRIHASLIQIASEDEGRGKVHGGRFGRMSCENPNLQQQPSRDDFANMWRSIYIPEEGMQWCCADISQQEPRWAAHFAYKMGLPGAAEMVRRYIEEPGTDNHQAMAEITGLPRSHAKIIGLGVMYGKGGFSLCEELGLPTRTRVRDPKSYDVYDIDTPEGQNALLMGGKRFKAAGAEGQEILDRYDTNAPFVRKLSKACQNVAKKRGYLNTVLGRRCRFPTDQDGNYDWVYRALNRLIQGSSADQMKKAMIDVDRAGHYLTLQVHDELDLSVSSIEEGRSVERLIQEAVPAEVPFKVDLEIGRSWGEIEKV